MTINEMKEVLLWCAAINYALLLIWASIFIFAHDWAYRILTRWFKLSVVTFDAMNLGGISIYKIGIILVNLVPWIALHLST